LQAITAANNAADAANEAKDSAVGAAAAATTAATSASQAAADVNAAKQAALQAAADVEAAKNAANTAAASANTAASDAGAAAASATDAAGKSVELNTHPPKIIAGEWWMWNIASHEYVNTGLPSRGPEGRGPIVLPSGNYGNWVDAAGMYLDSGVKASIPVEFTEAGARENIHPTESLPSMLGKISKWFTDFGPLAWKIPDVDHEPGEDDLTYADGINIYSFGVGSEARHIDADGDITFYKLYAITGEGKAVWEEIGGTSLPGNVYLTGANYYNSSVKLIQEGDLNG
jgi:hypothetical protein